MWNAARVRVRKSGRVWREPRVEAAIELTKHGASEERPDLREAYENLAARSMTEDEWEHDFEEYSQRLSKLQSGDIALLQTIHEKTAPTPEHRREGHRTFMRMLDLISPTGDSMWKAMETVDRLQENGLLIVRVGGSPTGSSERQPGKWVVQENSGVHMSYFRVLPSPRGVALLEHIAGLECRDQPADS